MVAVAGTGLPDAEIDRIFQALADATRRDILTRVIEREQSVSALAGSYRISLPAVQKHVAVLERAGLVGKTRHGREQRVHAEPERLRRARDLLEAYERLWRHRIQAMDALLAEGAGAREEGAAPCPSSMSRRTSTSTP